MATPLSDFLLRPFHSAAKSGKKVFVICRQQVDMPNQPTITIFLVINFLGNCKSGLPFGQLSQVCHNTCSSSAFLTAATVSFSQLHSTAPHSFHYTMLTAILFAAVPGILPPYTYQIRAGCTVPFASCCTVHLASFHCFLAISFQQASAHPLPIFILLAGSPT